MAEWRSGWPYTPCTNGRRTKLGETTEETPRGKDTWRKRTRFQSRRHWRRRRQRNITRQNPRMMTKVVTPIVEKKTDLCLHPLTRTMFPLILLFPLQQEVLLQLRLMVTRMRTSHHRHYHQQQQWKRLHQHPRRGATGWISPPTTISHPLPLTPLGPCPRRQRKTQHKWKSSKHNSNATPPPRIPSIAPVIRSRPPPRCSMYPRSQSSQPSSDHRSGPSPSGRYRECRGM